MNLASLAVIMLMGSASELAAQAIPPIQLSRLPHLAIISPVFYWDNQVDIVRTVSATCPSGRPISRRDSVQIAQYPRLLQLSHRFALTPGDITTAERQACTQNTLIISGGM